MGQANRRHSTGTGLGTNNNNLTILTIIPQLPLVECLLCDSHLPILLPIRKAILQVINEETDT